MIYQCFAKRNKSDGKEVLIAESIYPISTARLRERITLKSEEFADGISIREEVKP